MPAPDKIAGYAGHRPRFGPTPPGSPRTSERLARPISSRRDGQWVLSLREGVHRPYYRPATAKADKSATAPVSGRVRGAPGSGLAHTRTGRVARAVVRNTARDFPAKDQTVHSDSYLHKYIRAHEHDAAEAHPNTNHAQDATPKAAASAGGKGWQEQALGRLHAAVGRANAHAGTAQPRAKPPAQANGNNAAVAAANRSGVDRVASASSSALAALDDFDERVRQGMARLSQQPADAEGRLEWHARNDWMRSAGSAPDPASAAVDSDLDTSAGAGAAVSAQERRYQADLADIERQYGSLEANMRSLSGSYVPHAQAGVVVQSNNPYQRKLSVDMPTPQQLEQLTQQQSVQPMQLSQPPQRTPPLQGLLQGISSPQLTPLQAHAFEHVRATQHTPVLQSQEASQSAMSAPQKQLSLPPPAPQQTPSQSLSSAQPSASSLADPRHSPQAASLGSAIASLIGGTSQTHLRVPVSAATTPSAALGLHDSARNTATPALSSPRSRTPSFNGARAAPASPSSPSSRSSRGSVALSPRGRKGFNFVTYNTGLLGHASQPLPAVAPHATHRRTPSTSSTHHASHQDLGGISHHGIALIPLGTPLSLGGEFAAAAAPRDSFGAATVQPTPLPSLSEDEFPVQGDLDFGLSQPDPVQAVETTPPHAPTVPLDDTTDSAAEAPPADPELAFSLRMGPAELQPHRYDAVLAVATPTNGVLTSIAEEPLVVPNTVIMPPLSTVDAELPELPESVLSPQQSEELLPVDAQFEEEASEAAHEEGVEADHVSAE